MRISDWSSDVCSSDLAYNGNGHQDYSGSEEEDDEGDVAEYESGEGEEEEYYDDDDDDDRTESTALATAEYDLAGADDWRAAAGSQRRAQRRINATADDFSQDSHLLGEYNDIEEGQRSEQEDEVDPELRAYAERLTGLDQQADTWADDDDLGWLSIEITIEIGRAHD